MSDIEMVNLILAAIYEAAKMVIYAQRGDLVMVEKSEARFRTWQNFLDKMKEMDA